MNYWLHPEAAEEHKKQVAYYEVIQAGLGKRYHAEFQNVLASVCASPDRSRIVLVPDIRRAMFKVFTLTSSTEKSMAQFKCWPSPIIVANQAIGLRGFNGLIDATFVDRCQRYVRQIFVS